MGQLAVARLVLIKHKRGIEPKVRRVCPQEPARIRRVGQKIEFLILHCPQVPRPDPRAGFGGGIVDALADAGLSEA